MSDWDTAQNHHRSGTLLTNGTADDHAVLPATPRLASIDNFRDIAGPGLTGYGAANGTRLARGIFYRSSRVTPEPGDAEVLATLNITKVFDLRTSFEVKDRPDQLPPGAEYVHINIHGDDHGTIADLDFSTLTGELGKQFLMDVYRAFVTDEAQREEFGKLLQQLADTEGSVIFHCASGKDRTGWTAALLQTIAGVSSDDIMADYLLTNDYHRPTIDEYTRNFTAEFGSDAGAGINALLSVYPETLQTALDEADTRFGGLDGYLYDGLGLQHATLEALRGRLTSRS